MIKHTMDKIKGLFCKKKYEISKVELFEHDESGNIVKHWTLDEKTSEWRKD